MSTGTLVGAGAVTVLRYRERPTNLPGLVQQLFSCSSGFGTKEMGWRGRCRVTLLWLVLALLVVFVRPYHTSQHEQHRQQQLQRHHLSHVVGISAGSDRDQAAVVDSAHFTAALLHRRAMGYSNPQRLRPDEAAAAANQTLAQMSLWEKATMLHGWNGVGQRYDCTSCVLGSCGWLRWLPTYGLCWGGPRWQVCRRELASGTPGHS